MSYSSETSSASGTITAKQFNDLRTALVNRNDTGVRVGQKTAAEIAALNMVNGQVVWDTTANCFSYFNGTSTQRIGPQFLPNYTTAQLGALSATAGQLAWNTTTSTIWVYNGSAFEELGATPTPRTLPIARYGLTGQSFTSGATAIINFNIATIDTHSQVTTGASWKFEPNQNGKYLVQLRIQLASYTFWDIGEIAEAYIYKNGSVYSKIGQYTRTNSASASDNVVLKGWDAMDLLTTDDVDIRFFHNCGSAVNVPGSPLYTMVSIQLLQKVV